MRRNCQRAAGLAGLVLAIGLAQAPAWQLGNRSADEWIKRLDRPERVASLKIEEILAKLQLQRGDVVADIGAGAGVFTVPLAKTVSPGGKVYAVEIDQALLDYINRKVIEQDVKNVVTVLGRFEDPSLPATDVDLAFFHDVLHHIKDRAGYLKKLAGYLKPSARIAMIELDPKKGGHKDEPEMQLTKDQVTAWMADSGLKLVAEFDMFDDKWFTVYARR
jgi:ubiquinone/menaquinone biosynthesis C-methylase UbiE